MISFGERKKMKYLIIPSATVVPAELQGQFGKIPACLFPLQGKTMLQWLVEKYQNFVDRIYVVVFQEKQMVYDYVAMTNLPVEILELETLGRMGDTVNFGLRAVVDRKEPVEAVFVNFADTLISNVPYERSADVVYYTGEPLSAEWTFFEHNEGRIYHILDKCEPEEKEHATGDVFTGVFEFADPAAFLARMEVAEREGIGKMDPFYAALSQYSETRAFECVLVGKWYDVGHWDKYLEAKTKVQARAFNTVEIDENRGVLTKSSTNWEKFLKEIQWYLKMPADLQCFLPRIYSYSLDRNNPYVSMEYYGYSTLHELFVFGEISSAKWKRIFEKLFFVMQCMKAHRFEGEEDQEGALEDIYIKKTVARLADLKKSGIMASFFEKPIRVNGVEYPPLDQYIEKLPALISEKVIANRTEFCVIHGDLCFSNILVENDYCFLRLIDPRGEFGKFDIYGDPRYELAKLLHSLDGGYDFIIEDLFNVQIEGNEIIFELPGKRDRVLKLFIETFSKELKDFSVLKLIEALLFLSMVPLHGDYLNRQYAMLATGLRLVDEATKGDRSWMN